MNISTHPGTFAGALLCAALAALALSGCKTAPVPAQQQSIVDAAGSLASLAAANNTTAAKILQKGAVICGKASGMLGQLAMDGLVMAANSAGVPVSVINATQMAVTDTCAALGRVPGPMPAGASPAAVPIVSVPQTVLAPVVPATP
jgi:hypothetical protein